MVLIADTSQISGPLAKEALRRKLTQERKDAAKLKRTQLRTHVDPETPAPLNPTAALAQSLQSDIKLALEQSEATWSLLLQETQQLWDARVALQQAVGRGDVAAVEAQIKAGGELEFCDQDGNTMLMCAACLGHDDLVQSLLDMKAAPNRKNNAGQTALHRASAAGLDTTVLTLLEAGCNLNIQDKQDQTAAMVAPVGRGTVYADGLQVGKDGTVVSELIDTWQAEYVPHAKSISAWG
eukprot:TRINITY_DN619_c0_g1_i6.p1 TRINITY_DN619_c0_g1~~TRINITY_DN619_c0_g1_i6.p1  ORF type:complete len:238 (+),score=54.04 TRINITY_DN619_c0_g1_i6:142-855(+)